MRKYRINDECIYCGGCEPACPEVAIKDDLEAGSYTIDPTRCSGCPGSDPPPCVDACPVDAVVLLPATPRPARVHLPRFRGILRAAPEGARLLLAELRLRVPQAPETLHSHRAGCELELDGGRRLRLRCDEARVIAPEREERGPWTVVARSPLAECLGETRPATPHSYLELVGPAITAGERVIAVGEVLEQAFVEASGGLREAPRAEPTLLRARWVAADEPRSLLALESELDSHNISPIDRWSGGAPGGNP